MDKITELMQERASVVTKMRKVIDKAEEENRGLKAEEKSKIDKMEKEINEFEERINTLEGQREREKKEILNDNPKPETKDKEQEVFAKYLREGRSALNQDEKRAMSVGTDAKGGYLVPVEFHNTIIEKLTEENVMRRLATVSMTSSEKKIPVGNDTGAATWVDEAASYSEDDIDFSQKTVDAHKAGTIVKVSEELLYDNTYNLENYIQQRFVKRIADLEEAAFVDGDGSGKPKGFLQDAETGVDAAAEDAVTADEIIELYHAPKRPYRNNGSWLMNDTTAMAIRKLTDSNNQYLWQPGLQAGEPDVILGRPVEYSTSMPELESDKNAIAFGDFSYYEIFDRQGMGMQRLVEKYAENGQVGFRAYLRTDGLLIIEEAIQLLKTDDGQ